MTAFGQSCLTASCEQISIWPIFSTEFGWLWDGSEWGPKGGSPQGGEPKISRFFSLSRHKIRSFLPSLGVSSWNFGGVFEELAGEGKKKERTFGRSGGGSPRRVAAEGGPGGGRSRERAAKKVEHAQKYNTQQPENRGTHPTIARTHLTKHGPNTKTQILAKCGSGQMRS